MKTTYDPVLRATTVLDDDDQVRGVNHLDEFPEIEKLRGRDAAAAYLRDVAARIDVNPAWLANLEQNVSYVHPLQKDVEFRFSDAKSQFDTTTYSFYQTYLNIPVWGSGLTATVKQAPTRIVASTNTAARAIDARLPSAEAIERYRRLFALGEKSDLPLTARKIDDAQDAGSDEVGMMQGILGKSASSAKVAPRLIRGRFYVYQYDPAHRTEDFPEATKREGEDGGNEEDVPTLPLPPVPKQIQPGGWYVVAELILRLPYRNRPMNWRALIDVETNAVLYLRALTSGANALVFPADPITLTGNAANSPAATSATLNPLRASQPLVGLVAPAPGANQTLVGNLIQISDFEPATAAPPTAAVGADFNFDVRTNHFAAVNAYYHCDRFFRLVEDLGFSLTTYFDGTSFPVPVDHRGRFGSTDGIERNASCSGDGDGIANVDFELADVTNTADPMGIAADWRVVLHELGGHGILYDHTGTANFGFAHSAGDSMAVILNDPETLAADRFESFPWVNFIGRRHDRAIADGWGWGGSHDVGSYSSEQILATTLFRAYQSVGGDAADVNRRLFASRVMAYLILRAVGTLTPMSNPSSPAQFLAALKTADNGDWTSEGYAGGAYGKVLEWAFERQNLNGGARPAVDVYIDDGRAGEYQYQAVHWAATTIWNRRASDGLTAHQEPALGETNYAYVRVRNRGTSVANNVIVKAYHCKPSAGVLWPNDLTPMTTAQLSAGTLQPNSTEEKIVGPFAWIPNVNAWGHDCMLMIVSATGDPSNVDKLAAGEVFQDWRLVPNDNNVGQRNVNLVPGGGGIKGLIAGLHGKGFWVGNPGRGTAIVTVDAKLPDLLTKRGWRLRLNGIAENGTRLKSGEQRLVTFDLHTGAEFSRADVEASQERDIVITAMANGSITGGMVYQIDGNLEMPYNERTDDQRREECRDKAKDLLDCLDLPNENVADVRVRRISIDVEMRDGGCGKG